MKRALLAAAALLAAVPSVSTAQGLPVGDPAEDYLRVLQVAGKAAPSASFAVRPLDLKPARFSVADSTQHPWAGHLRFPLALERDGLRAGITDPELHLFGNTAYPWGGNDGPVWQGKGATLQLDAGAFVRYGPLTIELRPSLIWNQNAAFTLATVQGAGRSAYGNPWHPEPGLSSSIDLPQRFGPNSFWTLDPGQSSIRLETGWLSAGFGTENLWWGPGIRNSIVMSNNAPGIPHAFLATARPVDIGIGHVEAQWIWGRLRQSRYFDTTDTLTRRFVTGLAVSYAPSFAPGLYLGASRIFYENIPDTGLDAREYFLAFEGLFKASLASPTNPLGDDARDQIASIFARWVLPASGFEAYAEWARNDHSWDVRDFILEPEHSQGYTLGFQKVNALSGGRLLRINGELTHLERDLTQLVRAAPSYYAHHDVLQGYTQDGQVVGAGIGPGGDAQYLGADLFARWGRAGLFFQRQVNDNDAYYAYANANGFTFNRHDVSLTLGASGLLFLRALDLGAALAWTKELNRYFLLGNDVHNLNLRISLRWRLD